MSQTPSLKSQQFRVTGMDCGSCAKTIEVGLQQLDGVAEVAVSFATEKVKVSYDTDRVTEVAIHDRIRALGYTVETSSTFDKDVHSNVHDYGHKHVHNGACDHNQNHEHKSEITGAKTFSALIHGMDCGSCAKTVEAGLQQLGGVLDVSVSFATQRLQLSYEPQLIQEETICERIKHLGYTVEQFIDINSHHHDHHEHKNPKPAQRTSTWEFFVYNRRGQSVILAGVGLVLGLIAQKLALPIWIARAFYGVGIIIAGYPVARAGLFELRIRRADMNVLMSISVIGAILLGDWFEGALVVFLFSLGSTLQLFSIGRTRNAIKALMDLTPTTATVKRNGKEVSVNIESVQINEIITIRPGQRIALDGLVVSGFSAVDQSPITGESVPEDKDIGDIVYAGTMNQTGFLEVKVTHIASDTTVAKIIHLVEEAQESKAPSQQWVDKFAAIYTPIVILIALTIALIPPLAFAQSFNVWVYRALVMLVIACPCSLVISTPVSIVSAIGAATRQGVLFKGGHALETAGRLQILAFDKTGTITRGLPLVQGIYNTDKISAEMVLLIAASLEVQSEHPLAKAIVAEAKNRGMDLATPDNFKSFTGQGIWASLGEQIYVVGNRRLFKEVGIPISTEAESILNKIETLGQTPVLVGNDKEFLGAIRLADGLRLEATEALRQLKRVGLKQLVMLTGDRNVVAQQIAQSVGIDSYRAELLPQDKLNEIQQLRRTGIVGMVGDGINDAPALAAADISFALGTIDIALETADVVLAGSDLRKLAYAVNLSRRTVSVIQQNVVFSLASKGLFLLLGTFGFVGLAVAVLADTGSSLLVTANGMRLFKLKDNKFDV
ncbi:putative cadmium-transporting ATPase [Dulcicalothrix desertica PCC 7102]|uniref:Copper-exporting P-type ATPase n=1 Tax=Dulcicalothrix desertica PCC 7102 TaxID=232991 RepID=A0A3S1CDR0_9CYAN|nr:heavy metal translocating P-type ATPase [Dulcicalothrix desertica]RUT01505.1 putative cadmium-transporting ATPase [Dulcicalothrix desertica PCC 7102]